jgi:hypothetical protein
VTTSKIPALIDYLVATFTAAPALGAASPPVTVFDGPQTTEAPYPLVLWVGLDDPDADQVAPSAAASEQEWAGLGKQARNEISTIHCVAEAWTGADDIRGMRVAAFAIAAAVEDIVRTDPFSGLALFPDPGVTGLELRQNNPQSGSQARVSFQIVFKSRL